MEILIQVVEYLIFPGLLFAAVVGLVSVWVDRKVTALVQWRVGPPLLQPLYDFLKLLGKEIILPPTSGTVTFIFGPMIGLAGAALAAAILGVAQLGGNPFVGDLVVVVYLLVLPSLGMMLGASASGNPLSSVGASREMKLILAYELPFILCIIVAILKAGNTLSLGAIADQVTVFSISGMIAFLVSVLCIQAKLAFVPFDIPEAETEIMEGIHLEYSGALLGLIKLTQAVMLFALPVLLVTLFLGGFHFTGWGVVWGILKYVLVLVLLILIKNTNPRLRIDQAVGFFWKYAATLALLCLILAWVGQVHDIAWL